MHDNRAQFLKFHIRGSFFSVYCHVIFLHCVKSARIHSCYKSSSADGLYRVETCTDPCGPNRSDEAASTAADDDLYFIIFLIVFSRIRTECWDLLCKSPYTIRMRENKDQKNFEYGRFYAVLFVCTAVAIHLTVL